MKKLLLILLLTILPIQYAWSMAAVYCQHESSGAYHFGHHGHQHQPQAGEDPADQGDDQGDNHGQPAKAKVHGDCEVCHHAVQASVLDDGGVTVQPVAAAYAPSLLPRYLSYIADGPARPNWPLVA